MKFLFDIFPVILFFIAFKFYDIYVATAVAIAATVLQIGWLWLRRRKIENMLWVSLGVIVVVAVSAAKQWTPVLDPWLPIAAPIAGAFVGLVAGLYPALKAASVEPITALRQAL